MKNIVKNHPAAMFALLCAAGLCTAAILFHQSRLNLVLQKKIAAENGDIGKLKLRQEALLAQRETTEEKMLLLGEYEKQIPFADGSYVWVSRILHAAVPNCSFQISPPDLSGQQVPLAADYCAGTFQVKGSGRVDDLLRILQKLESDLPFARVQDLQFSINKTGEDKTEFSFSLMAIMKLDQTFEG